MVSYEKALESARNLKPNVDGCTEMTDAYIFGSTEDEFTIGGDGPVVVMKNNGNAYNMTAYLHRSKGARQIQEIKIK